MLDCCNGSRVRIRAAPWWRILLLFSFSLIALSARGKDPVHAKPLIDCSAVSFSVTIQVMSLNPYYLDKCDLDLYYLYTFRRAPVYLAFPSMFLQLSSVVYFLPYQYIHFSHCSFPSKALHMPADTFDIYHDFFLASVLTCIPVIEQNFNPSLNFSKQFDFFLII